MPGVDPAIMEVRLPPGWLQRPWWNIELSGNCRVYLNDGGNDPELRFCVWSRGRIPCMVCKGAGRIKRAPHEPGALLRALGHCEPEKPDLDGLLRCDALGCEKGLVSARWGAANDFCRVPGLGEDIARRCGARGLYAPSQTDVQAVVLWCDRVYLSLLHGHDPDTLEAT